MSDHPTVFFLHTQMGHSHLASNPVYDSKEVNSYAKWSWFLTLVARNGDRTKRVVDLIRAALVRGQTVLCISDRRFLARSIADMIGGPKTAFLTGSTSPTERREIVKGVELGEISFVSATSIAEYAFEYHRWDAKFDMVILPMPNRARYLPRIRMAKTRVVDYVDDHGALLQSYHKRKRILKENELSFQEGQWDIPIQEILTDIKCTQKTSPP